MGTAGCSTRCSASVLSLRSGLPGHLTLFGNDTDRIELREPRRIAVQIPRVALRRRRHRHPETLALLSPSYTTITATSTTTTIPPTIAIIISSQCGQHHYCHQHQRHPTIRTAYRHTTNTGLPLSYSLPHSSPPQKTFVRPTNEQSGRRSIHCKTARPPYQPRREETHDARDTQFHSKGIVNSHAENQRMNVASAIGSVYELLSHGNGAQRLGSIPV